MGPVGTNDVRGTKPTGSENNKLLPEDRAAHDWYRFVLSFPPHLVRDYLERFGLGEGQRVLDPFCGTGTTLVECKKRGITAVGVEANPMAFFASRVKTTWNIDAEDLLGHAKWVAREAVAELESEGIADIPVFVPDAAELAGRLRGLPEESRELLLKDSISPLPLHKTLVLLSHINQQRNERCHAHELLALAKALVSPISNLHFGPEVGVGPAKPDAPVVAAWLANVSAIANDLKELGGLADTPTELHNSDARRLGEALSDNSIHAVITSPPYPNEKDYTRTTRLESVILGFIRDKRELKTFKRSLMRSNTRNVYKGDDDDRWVASNPRISALADTIEARRIELGKTSGFERLYPRLTRLYFGGMARHLAGLRKVLRPGAHLAYVVGDQASYLRVMIRTGQILAEIAESLGYQVVGLDLFRTRLSTATREQLREEVLVLHWPGKSGD